MKSKHGMKEKALVDKIFQKTIFVFVFINKLVKTGWEI
jgi:hypothetical protein